MESYRAIVSLGVQCLLEVSRDSGIGRSVPDIVRIRASLGSYQR